MASSHADIERKSVAKTGCHFGITAEEGMVTLPKVTSEWGEEWHRGFEGEVEFILEEENNLLD